MIFGGWLTRVFASLWQPVAPCGGTLTKVFASLWQPVAPCGGTLGIPQTPYQYLYA